jgi:NADH-quinone oxidoreductase subunit H
LLPNAVVFFVAMLAETNRAPFDMAEAEAEIVAGYNLDYSSIIFAMFFLGEYANMILMSALFNIFFLGGWDFGMFSQQEETHIFFFSLKTISICFLFVLVRSLLPRYRYDQLMSTG